MNKRLTWILVAVVLVSSLGLTAIGKTNPHNLVITAGGGNSLFQVVRQVVLYSIDLKTGKRAEDPIMKVISVTDPLYISVPNGKYDIVVYVPWVSRGIALGQIVVTKDEVSVFDTREIELPNELLVR